jgi:hypothetical protein
MGHNSMMKISQTKKLVYHAFGLNIHSEIPFPDMPRMERYPDVVIQNGKVPREIPNAKMKGVRYQAGPGAFILQVDGIARYHVAEGSTIIVEREPDAADEEVLLFLMGSAMGALLHQRNILPLHASAVQVDGKAVLFIGPSSIGKSTLAGGFQKRGYAILADDVCAVSENGNGEVRVIPGFPRLKLWADTLKKLETEKSGLTQVRLDQDFKKYFVPFGHACTKPTPVRTVFLLKDTNTDRFEVSELNGMSRIEPLINNTYRVRFLEGLGGKQAHFRQCSNLADHARVIKLVRPRKGFRLEELMDLVERHW